VKLNNDSLELRVTSSDANLTVTEDHGSVQIQDLVTSQTYT